MEPTRRDDTQYMLDERRQRGAIIAALYRQRQATPSQPNVSLTDLEQLMGMPKSQFEFSLWYLTEGQFIKRTDNGSHSILMKGVDLAEQMMDSGLFNSGATKRAG